MAIPIRTNENIEGIKIGEDETRSLLYADDMTATLANISSVEKVIQILNDFEKCSGLKMNLSKYKAMWVGKNKHVFHLRSNICILMRFLLITQLMETMQYLSLTTIRRSSSPLP